MLLDYLREIEDHRRGQGRRYDLAGVLMCTLLGCLSGATSYRQILTFMRVHRRVLKRTFNLQWRSIPSYAGLRLILRGLPSERLETAFRRYSAAVAAGMAEGCEVLACDGKVLRGSFDHMEDRKAAQLLSIFATDSRLILAHMEIPDKTNEIPAFQQLVQELGLTGRLFTLDAMHAQKKQCGR